MIFHQSSFDDALKNVIQKGYKDIAKRQASIMSMTTKKTKKKKRIYGTCGHFHFRHFDPHFFPFSNPFFFLFLFQPSYFASRIFQSSTSIFLHLGKKKKKSIPQQNCPMLCSLLVVSIAANNPYKNRKISFTIFFHLQLYILRYSALETDFIVL